MVKKVKRRYLALKIESNEKISSNELMDTVWTTISKLFGEYGASQIYLNLISYNEKTKLAVIRTGHTTLRMVRAALASITRTGDKAVAVHILTVSGTIKALRKKL